MKPQSKRLLKGSTGITAAGGIFTAIGVPVDNARFNFVNNIIAYQGKQIETLTAKTITLLNENDELQNNIQTLKSQNLELKKAAEIGEFYKKMYNFLISDIIPRLKAQKRNLKILLDDATRRETLLKTLIKRLMIKNDSIEFKNTILVTQIKELVPIVAKQYSTIEILEEDLEIEEAVNDIIDKDRYLLEILVGQFLLNHPGNCTDQTNFDNNQEMRVCYQGWPKENGAYDKGGTLMIKNK